MAFTKGIPAQMLPKEGVEQATLFHWAEMQTWKHPELSLMFHVPNGGKRSATEAARMQKEGVKAGVPDIFLPVPRGEYHGMWIEMKRIKGGRVSEEQQKWHDALRAQGYAVNVCKGWQEAADCLEEYLALGKEI